MEGGRGEKVGGEWIASLRIFSVETAAQPPALGRAGRVRVHYPRNCYLARCTYTP